MNKESKKEILIFSGLNTKYSFCMPTDSDEDLEKVKEALKPLGYTFRFPAR